MKRARAVVVRFAAVALLPIALAAQQRDSAPAAVTTAELSGVVWSADANPQPVRRVVVSIAGGSINARSVITDDAGRFVFAKLPAATYTLTAKKPSFLPAEFGSSKPGRPGSKIALGVGEKRAVGITIFKGAAIAGSLRDENGQPVAGASVTALDARVMRDPSMILSPEAFTTDDRGEYRIYGLTPGDYIVVATALPDGSGDIALRREVEMDALLASLSQRQNRAPNPTPAVPARPKLVGFAPIYYPGTPMFQDSAKIHLDAGDERGGVSFVVSHVPVASIEGVVTGNVPSMTTVMLSITPEQPRVNITTGGITASGPDANGVFKYGNLAPGRYRIVARARSGPAAPAQPIGAGRGGGFAGATPPPGVAVPANGDMLYATVDVDVRGQDINGVSLPLQLGGTVSGKIVFDGPAAALPDDLSSIRVSVNLVGGGWNASNGTTRVGPGLSAILPAQLKEDGTFEIKGVGPTRYTIGTTLPPDMATGWRLRSAIFDGRDLLDTMIDGPASLQGVTLTVSDKRTQIAGVVKTAAGQLVSDCYVVAFSADRNNWRIGSRRNLSARPTTEGRFTLMDLPPGEYHLAVLTDLDPLDWQLPESLESLAPAAIKIRLTEGAKIAQDLQIR